MKRKMIIILTLAGLMVMGCAEEKKIAAPPTPTPLPYVDTNGGVFVPNGNGPGEGPGDNWEYGGTAEMSIVGGLSNFSEYTGRTMNIVEDLKINVNMTKYGDGYGGTVSISYLEKYYQDDTGTVREGSFTAGSSDKSAKYNRWFTSNGQTVFHAVLEDYMGGLVIVIDEFVDLGDGGPVTDLVGGTVWYKNFGLTYAPHPPTYCWFVSLGPYDCRPWPSGEDMNTFMSKDPQAGYIKVGRFSGLSLDEAFNGEHPFN